MNCGWGKLIKYNYLQLKQAPIKKINQIYDRSLHWVTPLNKCPIGFALKKTCTYFKNVPLQWFTFFYYIFEKKSYVLCRLVHEILTCMIKLVRLYNE
jgi:hypothetical protein